MRVWIGGPRIFGHRTGISLGPEDLRRLKTASSATPVRRPSAFVYVIRKASGPIKVGMGADPRERLRALQTGSSEQLELVYACAVKSNDANAVEFAAHDMMRNHRLSGEWFSVTPEMAVAAIAASAHRLNDPIVEIPVERIGEVLAIAEMQDAAARPKRRSFVISAIGVAAAIVCGLIGALGIQVLIILARSS